MKISLPFSTDSISSMQTDDRILFLGFALLLLDILKLTKAVGLVSVCLHKVTYLVAPPIFQRLYDGKKPFELFISTKGSLLLAKTRSYKSLHSVEIYKNSILYGLQVVEKIVKTSFKFQNINA